ncbi:MAG: type ISP restriction/modification enzyme [Planctomycetota bacterium]
MIKSYLKRVLEIAQRGDDTEGAYYSTLEELISSFAGTTRKKKVQITTLPKKTEAGNPDFRIWDGDLHITGYIEAKHPSEKNLDVIETSPQLKRYLKTFPNVMLTNFLEFRLYRDGSLTDTVLLTRVDITHRIKAIPPVEKEKEFFNLLEKFFSFSLPSITRAKQLAGELAKRTGFLKEQIIAEQLKQEHSIGTGNILGFYEAFQKYLIGTLGLDDFADLYAQTITYGLFAARTRATNGFNRKTAYDYIPRTIGILKQVFQFISLGELPPQMGCLIDDISEVLAVTDVNQILRDFYQAGKGDDPIIHFYETFLEKYNPKLKEIRGGYYTPTPVVSYIVRSIQILLKERFNRNDGLATDSVTVLDPAAGTLTFLAEASKLAVEEVISKYGSGMKKGFIKEHILKNFYAFELMMAPYAIGHLKMGFILQELGYQLQEDDRFKLYLTNTLEMEELQQTAVPGMSSLSDESRDAGKVKKDTPILVIMGNPPYYGRSANPSETEKKINKGWKYISDYNIERITKNGRTQYKVKPIVKDASHNITIKQKTWVGELIEDYKIIDGQWLDEKNPKWLQDDYVKFIRFAQHKIEQNGEGVLGFITNHSYLDNPTFRGMRQSLMNTFDEMYILDLHGNVKKKEQCPDGSKDENVFDIQQGVAIALFIKYKEPKLQTAVYHSDRWGLRENKYKWLSKNDIKTTKWQALVPTSDGYFFIPRDERLLNHYERYLKVTDIFPVNSVGIVTARDNLTIQWTPEQMWSTILNFSKLTPELARSAYSLGNDARDWKVELAQQDLKGSGLDKNKIVPILYRPFDIRYTYYTGKSRGFHCMPRPEVMQHMMKENLGLITSRIIKGQKYQHTFASGIITDGSLLAANTTSSSYLFPLYLYNTVGAQPRRGAKYNFMLFDKIEQYETRQDNLNLTLVKELTETYGQKPSPEDVFYYVYGVCYSKTYRTKYADFLKSDFPRIPFTKDYKLFIAMGKFGKGLADLHLMKSAELKHSPAKFQGAGDNRIKRVKYEEKAKQVYINETQYFAGIEKMVWEYQIGGYQVLDKYLKSRKDRELSRDEQLHYLKVITAIKQTMELSSKIDKIYPEIEKTGQDKK